MRAPGRARLSSSNGPTAEKAALPSDKSIAVLPLENRSADKDATAFFADGIHEEILTNLAHIRELRVVSRTSVEQYRGTKKPIPQIARELSVAYLLEGSVQRSGNTVRITGQLIRAATDEHVWAQKYDEELTAANLFAIQSKLAQAIAGELKATLSPEEKNLLARRPTENLAAYDLYLKAMDITRRGSLSPPKRREQESLLQSVVTLDPNFAEAWARLGSTRAYDRLDYVDRTEARLTQARTAIETATRLAPDSPEVIENLGLYYYFAFRDYARAEEQYQRAVRLQPNNASAIYSLGALYRRTGRWTEGVAFMRRSLQLDPAQQFYRRQLASLLTACRRYDEAVVEQRQLAAQSPQNLGQAFGVPLLAFCATGSTKEIEAFFGRLTREQMTSSEVTVLQRRWALLRGDLSDYLQLVPPNSRGLTQSIVLAAQGDLEGSRARAPDPAPLWKRLESEPDNEQVWRNLGQIEALLGHRDEALRCARKAVELLPESNDRSMGVSPAVNLAFVYAWTGDKDRAIAEYARLLRVPFSRLNIHEMKTDPTYFPLRGDPRFEALLNDPKNNAPLF
jgi:TolB-like protein/Flp pilus assembly protein TadD